MTPTRRDFLVTAAAVSLGACRVTQGTAREFSRRRPTPTPAQLQWQRDELAMFLHFGINTFSDREWGDGREDPRSFLPTNLDARQWARTARETGFRSIILTAKHHDGFCLWPTRTTRHSVSASPWRSGNGDVVREFVDACRGEGLRPGLYLSPWDRHEPSYGDSPRYNDLYCEQLTELLTRYGAISEVWFDGANGEGPNGRRQVYDWPRVWNLVRRLQPGAVMFSDAGPDIRWIGNERGAAGETNWSTVDPAVVPYPGASGDAVMRMLQEGDPAGSAWRPGETDVSIRPGWFSHPSEHGRVKTVDELVELYFTSVGRNSKLLLNVPPTVEGRIHEADVMRLRGMRARLDSLFQDDLAVHGRAAWRATPFAGDRTWATEIVLDRNQRIGIVDLREEIVHGQVVARYLIDAFVDGRWDVVGRGTTIGYRKLQRIAPVNTRRVRVVVEHAVATPRPILVGLYRGD